MTTVDSAEIVRHLSLFGIPAHDAAGVRELLARLVQTRSLSLGELQIARDVVGRTALGEDEPFAYLAIAALFLSQHAGNTFLRPEKGVELLKTGGYLEADESAALSNAAYGERIEAVWARALAAADALDGDVLVKRTGSSGVGWFFRRNDSAVSAVLKGLDALEATPEVQSAALSPDELATATAFRGFTLNADQLAAVRTVVSRRFAVVTGGPGTGKTTIVCAFLRALMGRGLAPGEIALVAPTGRAAQRMGEALRAQCASAVDMDETLRLQIESLGGSTIHSLLGGFPPDWKHTAENKLPLKLVVVDESSMVDVQLMKALIDALPSDCRLVLLGDKDQLPSVDVGAVLGDLVSLRRGTAVVRLTVSNRFTGALADCADAINAGDWAKFRNVAPDLGAAEADWTAPLVEKETENACFRYERAEGGNENLRRCLADWAERFGLMGDGALARLAADSALAEDAALTQGVNTPKVRAIFAALDRSRILTVVREGPFGARGVNDGLLRRRFGGRLPQNPLGEVGIPIIVMRNTAARDLWNGDVGVTVRGMHGMVVVFPRGDRVISCPVGLLPPCEIAYAITVHKSQGSEFGNVLVLLPDDADNPLLTRPLLYTGVTRAKKRAVVMGTGAAMAKALATQVVRDSNLL